MNVYSGRVHIAYANVLVWHQISNSQTIQIRKEEAKWQRKMLNLKSYCMDIIVKRGIWMRQRKSRRLVEL